MAKHDAPSKTSMRWTGLMALVLAPLLLAGAGLELSREFGRAAEQRQALIHSYEKRSQIQSVFSLMQDAETGQRGYIITGRAEFLEPYNAARQQLGEQLAVLEALLADEPGQSARLQIMWNQVAAKLTDLEQTIEIREQQGAGAAVAVVSSGRGKRLMDNIRVTVAEMTAAEAAALDRSAEAAHARTIRTEILVASLFALLVVTIGLATFLAFRTAQIRQRSLRAVQGQATRQRAIFDSTLDAIVTLNPSGSIESVNRSAEVMFGRPFADLDRRDIGVLVDLAPQSGGSFADRLRQAGLQIDRGAVRETLAVRSDGSVFPVDVALSEMHLPDGLHIVAAIRDISDRKRVEQMKQEFVSTVSHELRTPLTSIAGSLGLLRGGAAGPVPDTAARLISIAASNAERLVRLINDILDIEKIESGKMPLELQPLNLRELVARTLDAVSGYAAPQGVGLVLAPGDSPTVDGDADRITQVLTNLLSNAVKFSPEGAAVEIEISDIAGRARVSVRDHGPGVPEAFRDRIFSKFAQADSSDTRQRGGTGLGLAIAREIVERHGGRLHFESAPGLGATFFMDLPLAGGTAVPAPAEPERSPSLAPRAARPFVLHVEDDRDVAEVVASALADTAEVLTVQTLAAARAALSERTPDLIILDLGLPDGSGELLLPELRSGAASTPVVLYSAQDIDRRVQRQVSAALTKSRSSLDGLVSTVRRLTREAA